jgi:hypothetical protein
VAFPSERDEAWARFDDFFEEEHERLYKALYFVTGNRHNAEELMQDAFVKLWEPWGGDPPDLRPRRLPLPGGPERVPDALPGGDGHPEGDAGRGAA